MAGSELLRTLLLQASIAAVTSVPSQNTRTGPLLTLSLLCEYPGCKNIIRLFCLHLQKVSKLNIEMRECLLYKSQQSHCSGMPAPSIITRPRWLQLYFCWADSEWFSSEGATERVRNVWASVHRVQAGSFVLTVHCTALCCTPWGDNAILCHNANVYCWLPIFCPFSHYLTIHISICAAACKSPKTSNKKYLHNNSFETLENH